MAPDDLDPRTARWAAFAPGAPVAGEVRVPGSKSVAQRLLAAAAVAGGGTRLAGLPDSADVEAALACAGALGAGLDPTELGACAARIVGSPPDGLDGPEPAGGTLELSPGESGTAARLFSALAGLARAPGACTVVVPTGTLGRRRSDPLMEALVAAGADVEVPCVGGSWPARFVAARPGATVTLRAPGSSQEVSALMLALAAHGGRRTLRVDGPIPSEGYLGLTVDALERFGASVSRVTPGEEPEASAGALFRIEGPLVAPRDALTCEADASAAAVALAAAALSGGGRAVVRGVGSRSRQPDVAIAEAMAAFGCSTSGSGPEGLSLSGAPTRGARVDCSGSPDIAPVLAAVAAFVALRLGAESALTGLETLPGKESDRIAVLAAGLRALGLGVECSPSALMVRPGAGRGAGVLHLDPHGDHRMAFFGALLSLFEPDVRVLDPGCVAKSWPGFWGDLAAAGGRLSSS